MLYKGKVVKIAGPVVDVCFENAVPPINSLVTVEGDKHLEVVLHLSDNIVRTVALEATEGLYCGLSATTAGEGIKAPVGDNIIGRAIDVLGRPIDGGEAIKAEKYLPIHRSAPHLTNSALLPIFLKRELR